MANSAVESGAGGGCSKARCARSIRNASANCWRRRNAADRPPLIERRCRALRLVRSLELMILCRGQEQILDGRWSIADRRVVDPDNPVVAVQLKDGTQLEAACTWRRPCGFSTRPVGCGGGPSSPSLSEGFRRRAAADKSSNPVSRNQAGQIDQPHGLYMAKAVRLLHTAFLVAGAGFEPATFGL